MLRWSRYATILLALLLLSGCLDSGDDPVDAGDDAGDGEEWDDMVRDDLEGGEPEEWNATLEEPPEWRLGQWWQVRVTDGFSGSGSYEGTVVVAGAEDDWFLTGMAKESFVHEFLMLHIPPVGQVHRDHLAWDVHDELFQPVKFPLREGDTWDTHWSGQAVRGDVLSVGDSQAEVQFIGENANFTLIYDSEVGTVVSMDLPGYGTMEVTDHGFSYEGVVTVPHEYDLVFFHGRLAGAMGVGHQNMEPHPPVETITIEGDYDRVSFGLVMLALAPGVYAVDTTAPDGTQYQAELVATEPDVIHMQIHSHEDPAGAWETTFAAAGAGAAFIEGVGYHVFDIDLPSGCLLGATDEHAHHGGAEISGDC